MEKQKRWQFALIIAVIVLTLINILPTVFYYTKPLKEPVDQKRAENIAMEITKRVNELEEDSKSWLLSYSKLLHLSPSSIELKEENPGLVEVSFQNEQDAEIFKRFLPKAGGLIPFVPAQMELYPGITASPNTVVVARQIHVHLDPSEVNQYFHYLPKYENGTVSKEYRENIYDRTAQTALAFGGPSKSGSQVAAIVANGSDSRYNDLTLGLALEIIDINNTFGTESPIAKRYFASFTQVGSEDRLGLMQKVAAKMDSLKGELNNQRKPLLQEKEKAEKEGTFLESATEQRLAFIENQYQALERASSIIRANTVSFQEGKAPLTALEIASKLEAAEKEGANQTLDLEGRNPFVKSLAIDWNNDRLLLNFYEDVDHLRTSVGKTEEETFLRDKINQYVINDIARVSQMAEESIVPFGTDYGVALNNLSGAQSFLSFDLGKLADQLSKQLSAQLKNDWSPENSDLKSDVYPVTDYESFMKLNAQNQKLGLVIYAPSMSREMPPTGFRRESVYVIARGLDAIIQKYRETPNAPNAESLGHDVERLNKMLQEKGFIAYKGSSYGVDKEFGQDYIFELNDYYSMLLKATRENFYVKGSKKSALLDFTDVEQRILARNHIEDQIQEDLIKWRDEYRAAQVDIDKTRRYDVPAPTKNAYVENLKLSFAKYFRGDDKKIIRWGLDLSGGKTVRIGLRDHNNRAVTDPEDLKQAVNELYTRINKMGVAERTIRVENNNIILDFPGSQALSASELVKASAMYFHIVNEKFSSGNPNLRDTVNQFLQNVWNEAVVTNRKDAQSIHEIAWEHLGGSAQSGQINQPRSEYAKILYENGLRISNPHERLKSFAFNDTLSTVAVMRGEDYSEWNGQTNPLLIIFNNYALEGANLTNVQIGYDPSEGNTLNFGIKSYYEGSQDKGRGNPRDDFYAWTSQFSEDKIAGTPKEAYSQGRGWRMAVLLNDTVITSPHLRAALKDGATISGRFSQREITQLAADLKAGSLSFTPRILSEQNISAELGKEERMHGIISAVVGLLLVAIAMIGYYRFAGIVATCAVMFNLLIIWAVLQNFGAAITLPGIAGIVLTIGMAVDANVLVYERIREEFKISGRLGSAIQAGYKKAYSAIVDSNVTTLIAALILIQFDSGPIKGFAVTLIIGLVASMFTALFMTRYFFAGWVQNPKNKALHMREWIKSTKIDFLKYTKQAVIASVLVAIAGGGLFVYQRHTLFGMDFTGGYSLNVELKEQPDTNYRQQAALALSSHGAFATDFDIRELNKPNNLRIQLGLGMEQNGHPFYNMPQVLPNGDYTYGYQQDPRIVWVVTALSDAGLNISEYQLTTLDKNWSMMSGQFSDVMRNNALIALAVALVAILIYITLRFEFKYATAATIGIVHDVIVTLGILAMFKAMGFPVQIDLQVVGAIMTLVGYSLNDTIIVFDRVREDVNLYRKMKYSEIINHALNVTLSRTLMTGGTTLLVLLSLVTLGGKSIFGFSLVMTIGVIVGTFSSLFIASPILLYLHDREERKQLELKKA